MLFSYVFLVVGLLLMISESFIGAAKNTTTRPECVKEKGSANFLNIIIYSTLLLAFWINTLKLSRFAKPNDIIIWCAIAMILFGLTLRWYALLKLKKYSTLNAADSPDHSLLTSSLYCYIRHPAYPGVIIAFSGIGLALGSYLAMAALVVLITLAFLWLIRIEERALLTAFPEHYRVY